MCVCPVDLWAGWHVKVVVFAALLMRTRFAPTVRAHCGEVLPPHVFSIHNDAVWDWCF